MSQQLLIQFQAYIKVIH